MERQKRDLTLFILASAALGITAGIDMSFFNNYLSDTFNITVAQRTMLEFPRELPGFLVVFVAGLLIFLGDIRTAFVANILAAFGMIGLGYLSPSFGIMVIWMTLYSMGQHLFMPMSNSIGMNLSNGKNFGEILGRINGLNTAAFLVTSFSIAMMIKFFHITVSYRAAFTISALSFLISAIFIFMMTPHKGKRPEKSVFLHKRYNLYYLLSVLFGARKQIFITFGPWVLIKIFHQGVSTFAIIGFTVALIGMFFKPYLGKLIDQKGEKLILTVEAVFLVLICMGYAFTEKIFGTGDVALFIVAGCYVIDQLLSATTMARSTYVKKIAPNTEEVSPTLSMGLSIDHLVSMIIPWIGGLAWEVYGYQVVFLGGAVIALLNILFANKIKIPQTVD